MSEKGKVWLVGAGPSDAGLLTLRGLEAIKNADVVVYDRLIGSDILYLIPPEARNIYVGKQAGRHTLPQEEINEVLLNEALNGNKVVRLKGGDPFLFGRGGEELELLAEHGIPFEIVPGVTSAIAAPAYAGIPVTHRDCSSSLHIFTAHFSAEETGLDFNTIARLKGTLVFLMGVSSVNSVCQGLLNAGMPPETPAAMVENGTGARQRSLISTIANLPADAAENDIHSPAVIVVGKVAELANRFSWIENRPLHGKRIVVTRPRGLCEDFCEKIRNLGGEAIPFPCIETVPVEDASLKALWNRLSEFKWIAFTSSAGVNIFFSSLRSAGKDSRSLAGLKIAAIGTATAKSLELHGIVPDFIPVDFNGESLARALTLRIAKDEKLLLLRARKGMQELTQILKESGVLFEDIPVYETRPVSADHTPARTLIEQGKFDFVAFTSPSTVDGFVQSFPHLEFDAITAVCIGKETAAEAAKYGMRILTAKKSTAESMLETLEKL